MSSIIISEKSALERLQDDRNLCNRIKNGKIVLDSTPDHNVKVGDDGIGYSNQSRAGIGLIRALPIPQEVKSTIGALAITSTSAAAARDFLISRTRASRISKGLDSLSSVDVEMKKDIDEKAEDITKSMQQKALDRLRSAMDNMTESKFADANLKVLGATAKDMASVVEKLGPKSATAAGIVFNVYVPRQKTESEYTEQVVDAEIKK